MASAAPLLVGLGELLWDLLPGGKQLGGAPANFVYHAQALGARGIPVSGIGCDDLGRELETHLHGIGLETRYISKTDRHPTGTVTVTLDTAGVPSYTIHAPVAWDAIPFSEDLGKLAAGADGVCFGSLAQRDVRSRKTILAFLDAMKQDALRVFDINLRQQYYSREVVEQSLKRSHVFKLNDQELPVVGEMLGLPDAAPRRALPALAERFGLHLIALTRGASGSLLFADGQFSEHPGLKASVVDTVGAGDAFTAALVVGWLRGVQLDSLNRAANRVAAFVCGNAGATPDYDGRFKELWADAQA